MRHYFVFTFLLLSTCWKTSAQNIYRTACQGNLQRLDSLLQSTPVNQPDYRGRTLLHWAVACKQTEVFDLLIQKGSSLSTQDNEGATPLYMAVRFKSDLFFDKLLGLLNDDWKVKEGATLLEKAILNRDLYFVKKLVSSGVAVDVKNARGSTPLEIAKRIKATEIAKWLLTQGANEDLVRNIQPKGKYLGQKRPGLKPQIFAPNFISSEESEFGSIFNAKGTEFYYAVDVNGKNEIRYTRRNGNKWTSPEVILSHQTYGYNDPFLSPDEKRLYFISKRPLDGLGAQKEDHDIWFVEKKEDGSWSEPINAGPNINSDGNEYYISFTDEGTMFFSSSVHASQENRGSDLDVYASKSINGTFQKSISLGKPVNTPEYEADVFVAPDESYIIFCAIWEQGQGRGDLYVSFKNADQSWTKPRSLGNEINTVHHELCPYVTKDGRYLFYTSNQDIYWVDAKVIQEIKKQSIDSEGK